VKALNPTTEAFCGWLWEMYWVVEASGCAAGSGSLMTGSRGVFYLIAICLLGACLVATRCGICKWCGLFSGAGLA